MGIFTLFSGNSRKYFLATLLGSGDDNKNKTFTYIVLFAIRTAKDICDL